MKRRIRRTKRKESRRRSYENPRTKPGKECMPSPHVSLRGRYGQVPSMGWLGGCRWRIGVSVASPFQVQLL